MESEMPTIIRGIVRQGQIQPVEPLHVADGTEVLVALPSEGDPDDAFWRLIAEQALQHAWASPEDDVYDELSKG
jgi:hypothetical protein